MYNQVMGTIKEILVNKQYNELDNYIFSSDYEKEFVLLGTSIIKTIDQYRIDCNALHEKISNKEGALASFSQRIFLSKSSFFQNDIHDNYYLSLSKYSNELKEALVNYDNKEVIAIIVDSIFEGLCKKASKEEEKFVRVNYDADDYIFHDYISYLSDEVLLKLYSDFINRKSSDLLPNQKNLIKEFKKELNNRKLTIPKKQFRLL